MRIDLRERLSFNAAVDNDDDGVMTTTTTTTTTTVLVTMKMFAVSIMPMESLSPNEILNQFFSKQTYKLSLKGSQRNIF